MKKVTIMALLTAMALAITATGCGNKQPEEVPATETVIDTEVIETEAATEMLEVPATEAAVSTEMVESTENVEATEITEETETSAYTYKELDKTMYAKGTVNLRKEPNKDAGKAGSLKAGEEVKVTGKCNETGWYRIAKNNENVYVSDKYLSDSKNESASTVKDAGSSTKSETTASSNAATTGTANSTSSSQTSTGTQTSTVASSQTGSSNTQQSQNTQTGNGGQANSNQQTGSNGQISSSENNQTQQPEQSNKGYETTTEATSETISFDNGSSTTINSPAGLPVEVSRETKTLENGEQMVYIYYSDGSMLVIGSSYDAVDPDMVYQPQP